MSLDPAVEARVEDGRIVILPLVRFDIPGNPAGYHFGGRDFTWNGFTYKPNKYLDPGSFSGSLGNAVTKQTLTFSGVPTDDPNDLIAKLETLPYLNAPVIITFLCGDPETDEVLGILISHLYEIDKVTYEIGGYDDKGQRVVNVKIDIEPPGRTLRDQTYAKRSQMEQQLDNNPDDTFFEYAATNDEIPEEWGQVYR